MQWARGRCCPCGVGAKIGYAGETPVEVRWRVTRVASGDFTGTGPMFGGAKFHIGPMALVTDEDSGVSAVLAAARIQAIDQEQFRHVGIEPSQVPILALKSTVHFRADFQPDRRDRAVRPVARRACQRPGGAALPAFAPGHPAAAAGASARMMRRVAFAFCLVLAAAPLRRRRKPRATRSPMSAGSTASR